MFRLSKLADYGIVLLSHLARGDVGRSAFTARQLAAVSRLPYPTVAKVLKALGRGGLLVSQRGVRGGYALARPAHRISVAQMVSALEGPIALTQCLLPRQPAARRCDLESACPVRGNWQRINAEVQQALARLTLADMQHPRPTRIGDLRP